MKRLILSKEVPVPKFKKKDIDKIIKAFEENGYKISWTDAYFAWLMFSHESTEKEDYWVDNCYASSYLFGALMPFFEETAFEFTEKDGGDTVVVKLRDQN